MLSKRFLVFFAVAAAIIAPSAGGGIPDGTPIFGFAGQPLTLSCNTGVAPAGRPIKMWQSVKVPSNGFFTVNTGIKKGSRFTLDMSASGQYDLVINPTEVTDGDMLACGTYVQDTGQFIWHSVYTVTIAPASAAAEKDNCYLIHEYEPACKTYKVAFCDTFKCAKPKDCSAAGVEVCGDVQSDAQTEIVKAHNDLRQKIASGGESRGYACQTQPTGTNIRALSWDDELAKTARNWAEQEIWEHDCRACRKSPNYLSQGQNMAWNSDSSATWTSTITSWYDEVKDYNYPVNVKRPGVDLKGNAYMIGHYTQVVWATSYLVGCGEYRSSRDCGWTGKGNEKYKSCHLYVCNYFPSGNTKDTKPYSTTKKCSSYNSQWKKLCDS